MSMSTKCVGVQTVFRPSGRAFSPRNKGRCPWSCRREVDNIVIPVAMLQRIIVFIVYNNSTQFSLYCLFTFYFYVVTISPI